jgi:hypothetical protein
MSNDDDCYCNGADHCCCSSCLICCGCDATRAKCSCECLILRSDAEHTCRIFCDF